jgi:hypothetical protein
MHAAIIMEDNNNPWEKLLSKPLVQTVSIQTHVLVVTGCDG